MKINQIIKEDETKNLKSFRWFIRKFMLVCVYLCPMLLLAACGQGETADLGPTPTPLPTPIVPEKPTYTVQKGTVVNSLEFTGRVSPMVEQELFFKSTGFVDQVMVQRGDQVQAGDVLAQLEITELQNQLAQAQLVLETAETKLTQAEETSDDDLIEAQINLQKIELQLERERINDDTAGLTSSQINLEQAQRNLADAQKAYDTAFDPGREWELFITESSCLPGQDGETVPCTGESLSKQMEAERNGATRSLRFAEENLEIAQAQLNDAQATGASGSYDRRVLELELELAQLRVEQLARGVDPLLQLDVERARLDVQKIENQIADAQLIAPFDGEVMSLNVRPGSQAEAFQSAIVLAQPETLEITAELSSDQLDDMSVGQAATITLRNRPEDPFQGSVRQLPYAFSGGASDSGEDDTRVRIQFDDPPPNLELGELATVTLILEEKEDVLWLPPAAIRRFQGRTFVVIEEADGQRRADVRLGIESDSRVEMSEGVEEGRVIIGE